jgi:D-tyrosyl-tRNA(Tyr) deacylase
VIQRVSEASVRVDGDLLAGIGRGLMVLLGVGEQDDEESAAYTAGKIAGLRVFQDREGLMNLSVVEVGGAVLVIPQFTLYGDCRKGRRPSFGHAAPPDRAKRLYKLTVERLRGHGLEVQTGSFGAEMSVSLVNEGPVTLLVDSARQF